MQVCLWNAKIWLICKNENMTYMQEMTRLKNEREICWQWFTHMFFCLKTTFSQTFHFAYLFISSSWEFLCAPIFRCTISLHRLKVVNIKRCVHMRALVLTLQFASRIWELQSDIIYFHGMMNLKEFLDYYSVKRIADITNFGAIKISQPGADYYTLWKTNKLQCTMFRVI